MQKMELSELLVKRTNKIKAFGLAEVLVGLAITGGILITIMTVASSAYRQVKNNEMGDAANNVMIMGVEYFKTPVTDITKEPAKSLSMINVGEFKVYTIATKVDDNPVNFQLQEVTGVPSGKETTDLTECVENGAYVVKFSDQASNFLLCNKIVVSRDANGYKIFSTIAYKDLKGVLRTSNIIGIRQQI